MLFQFIYCCCGSAAALFLSLSSMLLYCVDAICCLCFWMLSNRCCRCCRHHRRPIVVLSMCLRNVCVGVHEWSGRSYERVAYMIIWYQAINTVFTVQCSLISVFVLWTRFGQTNRPPERCTNYTVKSDTLKCTCASHTCTRILFDYMIHICIRKFMCDMCTLSTLYSYTNMLGTLINIVEAWTHSLSSIEKNCLPVTEREQTILSCIFRLKYTHIPIATAFVWGNVPIPILNRFRCRTSNVFRCKSFCKFFLSSWICQRNSVLSQTPYIFITISWCKLKCVS